ncbi:MAG: hypothetical protein PHN75_02690 [Syntrophales bacterium]|nr:hypothetical protein [Syntrophales bacterium]
MRDKAKSPAGSFRLRAEERWQEKKPQDLPALSDADAQRLIHELRVHQIELEMQNEELQRAWAALAESTEKYEDFYEFTEAKVNAGAAFYFSLPSMHT